MHVRFAATTSSLAANYLPHYTQEVTYMVEKRNRLKVTRPGSLLSVLIDVEISDTTMQMVRDLVDRIDFIERRQDFPQETVLERYQRESR